jgi:hypothetical protein
MLSPHRISAGLLALGLVLTTSACDSNEPDPDGPGEQEFITSVQIALTNTTDASDAVTITASDPDGDGAGIVFSPTSVTLRAGATYDAAIELRDDINDEEVTEEIGEEAEAHLFRYTLSPAGSGTVTITDRESDYVPAGQDENGAGDLPVGLTFRVVVAGSAAGAGTFNATLFHFDEGAVKNSATATSDERDIDIDFPVTFVSTSPLTFAAPPTAVR